MSIQEEVNALYEKRPYPPVGFLSPFLQKIRKDDLPLMNYTAGFSSVYGSTQQAVDSPRILVAGAGTFEPVVVAMANPDAEILAIDLSARSLAKLEWQAKCRGLGKRIRTLQCSLDRIPEREGIFDYIIATGVIHHLEDPEGGMRALMERAGPRPLFRLMIYSKWGRSLLYGARSLGEKLGVKEPAQLRQMIQLLPPRHPYRVYFHLYSDAKTDGGLSDGYLHPCDKPFTALELKALLEKTGLRSCKFLQRDWERMKKEISSLNEPTLEDWEQLAILEALGELDENFLLFAGKEKLEGRSKEASLIQQWVWNPCLPKKGQIYSKLVGNTLEVDQSVALSEWSVDRIQLYQRALFLLPKE